MPRFFIQNTTTLEAVSEFPFTSEDEIKTTCEKNINTFFSLQFVASEFRFKNFRLDTLAFDPDTNAFVIIEYKKGDKYSIVDQGFAYLSQMLRNKEVFSHKYNTTFDRSLKSSSFDWARSKIIFISQSFTPYQQNLVCFKELPIELHLIKRYSGNIITLEKLSSQETISLTNLQKNRPVRRQKVKRNRNSNNLEDPFYPDSILNLDLNKKLMKKIFDQE